MMMCILLFLLINVPSFNDCRQRIPRPPSQPSASGRETPTSKETARRLYSASGQRDKPTTPRAPNSARSRQIYSRRTTTPGAPRQNPGARPASAHTTTNTAKRAMSPPKEGRVRPATAYRRNVVSGSVSTARPAGDSGSRATQQRYKEHHISILIQMLLSLCLASVMIHPDLALNLTLIPNS